MINLVKMFGEYNTPYVRAKKVKGFKITWNTPYEEVLKIVKAFEKNGVETQELKNLDCICCVEFGNVSIEFMCYGTCESFGGRKEELDTGFLCCSKWERNGWDSDGFSDMELTVDKLEDKNKFEKEMYLSMMEYTKKNKLTWSKLNK